jgi:hypothetical protein
VEAGIGFALQQKFPAAHFDSLMESSMLIRRIFGMGTQNFYGDYGPSGSYGAYPSCGCSSLFIILAGILLVFGGCLRMFGQ